MNDSPLVIPGQDLIEKFTKEKKTLKAPSNSPLSVDGHVDLPHFMLSQGIDRPFSELTNAPVTAERIISTNTRLFCTGLHCEDEYNGRGSHGRYQEVLDFTLSHLDSIDFIKDRQELDPLEEGPIAHTILLLENADFLADDPHESVAKLKEDGIRLVGLTLMGKNRLADGNAVAFADGITDVGKQVIEILVENRLLIDTSHLHPKSFWQLMDLVEHGLFCSHTGIQEAFKTQRNIDLNQAKQIIERGGVIGITFNPEMLSSDHRVGLDTVFAHLDTIVQKFGPSSVAIGSGLGGFSKAPAELSGLQAMERLQEILFSHGYDDASVKAIRGLNWLRFFQENLL